MFNDARHHICANNLLIVRVSLWRQKRQLHSVISHNRMCIQFVVQEDRYLEVIHIYFVTEAINAKSIKKMKGGLCRRGGYIKPLGTGVIWRLSKSTPRVGVVSRDCCVQGHHKDIVCQEDSVTCIQNISESESSLNIVWNLHAENVARTART